MCNVEKNGMIFYYESECIINHLVVVVLIYCDGTLCYFLLCMISRPYLKLFYMKVSA